MGVEPLDACHVGEREVLPQDTVDAAGTVEERGNLGENAQNSPDLDDVMDDAFSVEEPTVNVVGQPQEETKSATQKEEDVDIAAQAVDCLEESEDAFREA